MKMTKEKIDLLDKEEVQEFLDGRLARMEVLRQRTEKHLNGFDILIGVSVINFIYQVFAKTSVVSFTVDLINFTAVVTNGIILLVMIKKLRNNVAQAKMGLARFEEVIVEQVLLAEHEAATN